MLAEVAIVGSMKILRSDQGKEYRSMKPWLRERQMNWQKTNVNTPEQNSDAEVRWKILFGMIRSMLHFSNLNIRLWPFAMMYGTMILNRTITDSQK